MKPPPTQPRRIRPCRDSPPELRTLDRALGPVFPGPWAADRAHCGPWTERAPSRVVTPSHTKSHQVTTENNIITTKHERTAGLKSNILDFFCNRPKIFPQERSR